jgi:hypothetical protein
VNFSSSLGPKTAIERFAGPFGPQRAKSAKEISTAVELFLLISGRLLGF